VRTEDSAFEKVRGEQGFKWSASQPRETAVFDAAMTSFSTMTARAVVDAYAFSDAKVVVDITSSNCADDAATAGSDGPR
jgi:hypothetical protein